MIGDCFAIEYRLHECLIGLGRTIATGHRILGWHDPERSVALGG
jgi:hypothetical protein